MSSSSPAGRQHYFWLDWIRFLAAFVVMACHARGGAWVAFAQLEPSSQKIWVKLFFLVTRPGLEAVVVFFVLSGFLVGGKVIERTAQGTFDIKSYVADRISRIYVPLVPALFLTAAITILRGIPISGRELAGNLFGLQGMFAEPFSGNAPLWSLSYEMWFYIFAGLIALIFTTRALTRHFAFVGVMICFVVFGRLNASMLFCWLIGAIGLKLVDHKPRWSSASVGAILFLLGFALSQLSLQSASVDKSSLRWLDDYRNLPLLMLSVGLMLVIPSVIRAAPRTSAAAAVERLGTRLAAFSYTLYLTHYPLLQLYRFIFPTKFTEVGTSSLVSYLARVSVCTLSAWLLYLLFEARTPSIRDSLRRLIGAKRTHSPSSSA